MPEQLSFDFSDAAEVITIRAPTKSPDPAALDKHLLELAVPASFDEEPPRHRSGHQSTLAEQMEAAELLQPDPLEIRVPRVGDTVEMLWAKAWPKLGWTVGTVLWIAYPASPIMAVRMQVPTGAIWSCYVSRQDRARNPNIEKGIVWRWPERGGRA